MKTKAADRNKVGLRNQDSRSITFTASVADDEWEKLRPVILRLFIQLRNGSLD